MPDSLGAVRSSADRMVGLVPELDDQSLIGGAYPTEWSIADVISTSDQAPFMGSSSRRPGSR